MCDTLSGTGVPLLGVIANGFKTGRRGSYGAYAYNYSYVSEKATGGGTCGRYLAQRRRPGRRAGAKREDLSFAVGRGRRVGFGLCVWVLPEAADWYGP